MKNMEAPTPTSKKKDAKSEAELFAADKIEEKKESVDALNESQQDDVPEELDASQLKQQLTEAKAIYEEKKAAADVVRGQFGEGVDLGESEKEIEDLKKIVDDLESNMGESDNNDSEAIREKNMEDIQDMSQEKIEAEIKEMPKEEREKLGIGLKNMGFFIEKWKNDFFAKSFDGATKLVDKKGSAGRFLASLSETFKNDSERAEKSIKETENENSGIKTQLSNAGKLTGNILKIGRIVADFSGATTGLRGLMMAGSAFSRGSEAAKEARLKNEKVINKTRVESGLAEDEAWKVYEKAQEKSGEGEPSKDELEKAYQEKIPEDVLKRLNKSSEPGVASNFIQGMAKKHIEFSAKRMDKKIKSIENNKDLSDSEKKSERDRILNKYSKKLNDWDRIVSQAGTADTVAMTAKYAEGAGKVAVGVAMAETISKLWEKMPDIFASNVSAAEIPEGEFNFGNTEYAGEVVKDGNLDVEYAGDALQDKNPDIEYAGDVIDDDGSAIEDETQKAKKFETEKKPSNVGESLKEENKIYPESEGVGKSEIKEGKIDFGSNQEIKAESPDNALEEAEIPVETPDASESIGDKSSEAEETVSSQEVVKNTIIKNTADMRQELSGNNSARWDQIRNMKYDQAIDQLQPYEKEKLAGVMERAEAKYGMAGRPMPGIETLQQWTRRLNIISKGEKI